MKYLPEKHYTFLKDDKPMAIVRYDMDTRHRVIYMCTEAEDQDLDDLFSHYEEIKNYEKD